MSDVSWKSINESIFAMVNTGATAASDKITITVTMIAASRVVNGDLKTVLIHLKLNKAFWN